MGRDEGGKSDMERLGVFSEVGYTTLGDKYPKVHPSSRPINQTAHKGKQMLPGGSKTMSASQSGYFEPQFKRIMEKESYIDPVKLRRQERLQKGKKNIGKSFLPSNYPKKPSGAGNHYGTLSGPIQHFSSQTKPKAAYIKEQRNFLTNPSKHGTGYGYVGVTLGKYQDHAVDPYNRMKELNRKEMDKGRALMKGGHFKLNLHPKTYFNPNVFKPELPLPPAKPASVKPPSVKPFKHSSPGKALGGSKAGCFDNYPSHSNDLYTIKQNKKVTVNSSGKLFHAIPGPKSRPTPSVMQKNVEVRVNRNNYKRIKSVM
ncbi:unnamed protein product [Oikopleura dioica]|uniref:Cilia-and flagella-associated protein 96 n=1 Tax=Oikopleura dioica TaxID=34765 RepID=E4WS36_OIKDI|nr:unnamed protein product [Oikopleura dioica]